MLEVLFTPADALALADLDLADTTCVVFDVLRATSTIVTALAHGATAIIPVAEIPDALALQRQEPQLLLAGERNGMRIDASISGGKDFDFGNSPREFNPERVRGKTIALSTTNGSRVLRACAGAETILIGSFLNLQATADYLKAHPSETTLLVCSGTGHQAAYEDVLCAGALAGLIWPSADEQQAADSAIMARQIYEQSQANLMAALAHSRNARRLLAIPELRGDISWCLQRDVFPLVARMVDSKVIRLPK
ncbi:MAG: 2-phosphosulfolactate phosphatase [Pedosphaera sp.]|nr:2-phosphosulfolactate phosphatase [Pedosphaera sp.]